MPTTAGKELNVSTEYLSPTSTDASGPTLARLMQAAVAKKPDAIVVGNFFPEAQNPEIKAAVKAGIPVVVINSGVSDFKQLGALSFVGIEPVVAGDQVGRGDGQARSEEGAVRQHGPGQPRAGAAVSGVHRRAQEGRWHGEFAAYPLPGRDQPHEGHPGHRGRTQGGQGHRRRVHHGLDRRRGRADRGERRYRKLTIGSGDLSTKVLKDVEAGKIQYAMDQQPYLQTYYGVLIAKQYVQYRIAPSGTVLTGPLVIDKDSAGDALKINETYQGIRGAS